MNSSNSTSSCTLRLPNPHLNGRDYLYHLGLTTEDNLKERFHDVKFICMGGKASRMQNFAIFIYKKLGKPENCEFEDSSNNTNRKLKDIAESAGRYSVFKVGPVISASHGIGSASMSSAIHELLKLIHYAGCSDVTVIRIGTSGGLGLEPGTVVVTKQGYNAALEPRFRHIACGKTIYYDSSADLNLVKEIHASADYLKFNAIMGNTMSTDDFYEEQGRLDGALCSFTAEDKMRFLQKAHDECGIRNIEMEATCLLAMCNRANVKAAVVCVAIVNRLLGDVVTDDVSLAKQWEMYPQEVVAEFIKKRLSSSPQ